MDQTKKEIHNLSQSRSGSAFNGAHALSESSSPITPPRTSCPLSNDIYEIQVSRQTSQACVWRAP